MPEKIERKREKELKNVSGGDFGGTKFKVGIDTEVTQEDKKINMKLGEAGDIKIT